MQAHRPRQGHRHPADLRDRHPQGRDRQCRHTDRAKVTGTPLTSCPVQRGRRPVRTGTADATASASKTLKQVVIDGKTLCEDTRFDSNQDDWNGYRKSLAQTGASIALIALSAVVVLGGGAAC